MFCQNGQRRVGKHAHSEYEIVKVVKDECEMDDVEQRRHGPSKVAVIARTANEELEPRRYHSLQSMGSSRTANEAVWNGDDNVPGDFFLLSVKVLVVYKSLIDSITRSLLGQSQWREK